MPGRAQREFFQGRKPPLSIRCSIHRRAHRVCAESDYATRKLEIARALRSQRALSNKSATMTKVLRIPDVDQCGSRKASAGNSRDHQLFAARVRTASFGSAGNRWTPSATSANVVRTAAAEALPDTSSPQPSRACNVLRALFLSRGAQSSSFRRCCPGCVW